ncbi:tail fiber assembly protein, partial [Shigella flexneri]
PDDAVEISESEWKTLINSQSVTKMITCGENGHPVIVDRPSPTPEQLALINNEKKSALIAEATNVIAPLQDAVDLDMATDDETKLLLAWKKYRALLMRVDIKNTEWPKKPESNL